MILERDNLSMKSALRKYKHAVIATDTVIFTVKEDELNVLLIKMKKKPYTDYWAAPGGLVNPDETVDESAKRNLNETTGVINVYLEQLYTFGSVDRDPFGRVVSVAYFALVLHESIALKTNQSYADVRWFGISRLPELAYDHAEIIQHAIERLRSKLEYTNIVYSLMAEEFTLTEMQRIYEIILNRSLDKRNFRKKILSIRLVEKTGHMKTGKACRPAALYRFKARDYRVIQIL